MAIEFREIPGLSIVPNSISDEDEERLVNLIQQGVWAPGPGPSKRQVQQYGKLFDHHKRKFGDTKPIPEWLLQIAKQMELPVPENVIISKYEPGEGVPQYTDTEYFGEVLASLSLVSATSIDFKFGTLEHSIWLEPRTLLKLSGEVRHRWTHGIASRLVDVVNGEKINRCLRYSITFRTFA